ncbi:hypothetical protein BDZ89DRAFT_1127129 [Hymenopellis radicata]|nr:hypothetical protein BDZ89DRAFT_1127129 [Hymenopellis radicata]
MSPRKRVRLTAKPKSHKVSRGKEFQELRADGTPTEEEFESWDEYGRFVVTTDPDDKSQEVKKGDFVLVLPPESPTDTADFWIARVRSIRSPSIDTHNVWVKVQWFYSPADLAPMVKTYAASLPPSPSSYCPYERIFSDHFDYIHHGTIDGVVSVQRYEEQSLSPPYIEPESFWTRYDYERGTRCILPRPLPFQCTDGETGNRKRKRKDERRCGAYQPDEIMHLCPNPDCMRWWHARCLSPSPSPSTTPPLPHRTRGKRKSSISAPVIDALAIQRIITSSSHLRTGAFDPSLLQDLGQDIITAASQPMVRGGRFGVVGNVREVAEARSRVLHALEDSAFSAGCVDAEEVVHPKKKGKYMKGGKLSKSSVASVKKKKSEPLSFDWERAVVDAEGAYTCPRCGGAI